MRYLRRLRLNKGPKRLNRGLGGDLLVILFVGLFSAFSGLPLVYAAISAFKPLGELFIFPPRFFVIQPTWGNFVSLFQLASNMWVPFIRYIYNSVFITGLGTLGQIVLVSLAAYPLARHDFPGRTTLNRLVVFALLFSSTVTAVPSYVILTYLNLINTHWAMILPAMQRTLGLFLMISFMMQIPGDTLEAARIDGAGEFGILWRIVMPVVKPATMTMVIFCFQELWRESGGGYIYTENLKTLPTALSQITTAGVSRAGVGSATTLLMMIPPIIIFFIAQQNVMETMAHSGIKG